MSSNTAMKKHAGDGALLHPPCGNESESERPKAAAALWHSASVSMKVLPGANTERLQSDALPCPVPQGRGPPCT